ncbi:MAG: 30S ribosome-binding factor RbfA, partial [Gammaproteobacteria bacterium]|nr:30S ribosome-binding factor RbfA [Gammaproteobacteria bacterium]
PKEFSRTRRVGELVRRELAVLIASELNDPRVGMVTITAVDITKDLRLAKVRVTCLGSEEHRRKSVAALNNAAGFLRRCLSRSLELRVTPALLFTYDSSIERGIEMSSLIDSVSADRVDGQPE